MSRSPAPLEELLVLPLYRHPDGTDRTPGVHRLRQEAARPKQNQAGTTYRVTLSDATVAADGRLVRSSGHVTELELVCLGTTPEGNRTLAVRVTHNGETLPHYNRLRRSANPGTHDQPDPPWVLCAA